MLSAHQILYRIEIMGIRGLYGTFGFFRKHNSSFAEHLRHDARYGSLQFFRLHVKLMAHKLQIVVQTHCRCGKSRPRAPASFALNLASKRRIHLIRLHILALSHGHSLYRRMGKGSLYGRKE